MKLSVLICMYNSTANVLRNLNRLAEQIEPGVEVIVYDDCSTEDTKPIIAACAQYGFRYLFGDSNRGEAYSRQRTMDEATGDYFTWLDADDTMTDNYIPTLLLELGPFDIIERSWKDTEGNYGPRHEWPMVNWNVWANTYRREFVKDVPFDTKRQIASDYFWLEEVMKKKPTVLFIDHAINVYNAKNQESLTHRFERGEIEANF